MKLTKAQQSALDKIRDMEFKTTDSGNFETGINTNTLQTLRRNGLIECTMINCGGVVSKDIKIVEDDEWEVEEDWENRDMKIINAR